MREATMSVCMGGWLEILQVTIPNTPLRVRSTHALLSRG